MIADETTGAFAKSSPAPQAGSRWLTNKYGHHLDKMLHVCAHQYRITLLARIELLDQHFNAQRYRNVISNFEDHLVEDQYSSNESAHLVNEGAQTKPMRLAEG